LIDNLTSNAQKFEPSHLHAPRIFYGFYKLTDLLEKDNSFIEIICNRLRSPGRPNYGLRTRTVTETKYGCFKISATG
jgi:hypothetical protein